MRRIPAAAMAAFLLFAASHARAGEAPDSAGPPRARLSPDTDGDGVVSRAEFLAFRLYLFFGREEDRPDWDAKSRLAFSACDTNGDGVLNSEEQSQPGCGL